MSRQLLRVQNLVTEFSVNNQNVRALRDISFSIDEGETLCVVGESGCGKSVTSLSIIGLLPENANVTGGTIHYKSKEIQSLKEEERRKMRGSEISMIFQEPMTALNPVLTIGYQLREPLMIHKKLSGREADKYSVELLRKVGIPSPAEKLDQYPHQLSGGMRQRVMIAIALAGNPKLLIADEPTTALDVTIQAQILDLINELKEQLKMSIMFITHDMGVVAEVADRVMVMYAGQKVEVGLVEEIFGNPKHPYTVGLLNSVPDIDNSSKELEEIPGALPSLTEEISGCRFHPRCSFATNQCKNEVPKESKLTSTHQVNCWLVEEGL